MVDDVDDMDDCETSVQSSSSAKGADGFGDCTRSCRLFLDFFVDSAAACGSSDRTRLDLDFWLGFDGTTDDDDDDADNDEDEVDVWGRDGGGWMFSRGNSFKTIWCFF